LAADYSTTEVFFGTKSWYRITGSAGNQAVNYCVNGARFFCSGQLKGWINGTLPSVEEGEVQRQVLFGLFDNCADTRTTTTIRNCDGFFVYQFPSANFLYPSLSKICSQYIHGKLKYILIVI
jgi:hypothetical protein